MRPHPVYTCGLLTYPVLGTSPRGGADDSTRMAASLGGNGVPSGGGGGVAGGLDFYPVRDASFC